VTETAAIRFARTGGPDVLELETVAVTAPGPGEVLLRQTAVGVNFIDCYHRSGLYPLPLPSGIGMEAAGVVEALGEGVIGVAIGDRVAYCMGPIGAYAGLRVYPASRLLHLPDGVADDVAAGAILKGLTAWYLLRKLRELRAGDAVLLHAAAGGVGLIVCQWARHLGLRLIGTVGTAEKAALARANGASETILYRTEDVAARVRELTDGDGVPMVLDSVGRETWQGSLDSLAPRGLMVSFGNSSGPVGAVDPLALGAKGSLFLTRPSLAHYSGPTDLADGGKELLGLIEAGTIGIEIGARRPLREAADAHRALEAAQTTGSTILIP
jgi:NADPH2:quinone reductase